MTRSIKKKVKKEEIEKEIQSLLKKTKALNHAMADVVGVYKYIHVPAGEFSLEQIYVVPEKFRGVYNFTYSYLIEKIGEKWTKPEKVHIGYTNKMWELT